MLKDRFYHDVAHIGNDYVHMQSFLNLKESFKIVADNILSMLFFQKNKTRHFI